MCDLKKMHHHAKCSHAACNHHQPGSLPYQDCVLKARHSCLNEDKGLQVSPFMPPPQPPRNNMDDGSCRGKRFCHTKLNNIEDDDIDYPEKRKSHKWDDGTYAVEDKEDENLELHRGFIDSFQDVNDTFMRGKNLNTKYLLGNNGIKSNTGGGVDEIPTEFDEPGLVHVESSKSGEGSSSGAIEENKDEEQVRKSVEDNESPSQDVELDVEDEMMNGRLLEILENELSSNDNSPIMDRRQKRVLSDPEENVEDDTEFHSSRTNWNRQGSEGYQNEGCHHGSSNIVIHCMKFSELWYEVYQFTNLTYKHVISLQVFEKNYDPSGSRVWVEATKGKPFRLSSTCDYSDDSQRYQVLDIKDEQTLLTPEIHRLLVPRIVEGRSKKKHPEATDNPAKFLILNEDLISANGSECDKAGVSAETFVKQKARCTSKKGLCLKNQPSAIWKSDKVKTKHGHGKFLLANFGPLSKNAYMVDEMSGNRTLSQDFNGTHVSQVDVAVPAVNNLVIRKGMPAEISTVVTDATHPNRTIVTVSVINLGLASANFTVLFGKCYPNVIKGEISMGQSSSDHNSSRMVVISPMNQFDFTITLNHYLPRQIMSCIVKVLNAKLHLLAARRITIESGGRCICLWHCQCDCLKAMVNIKCKLMSLAEVKASGLKGTIPSLLPLKPSGYLIVLDDEMSSSSCAVFFLFGVLLVLLLLGLAKAILGVTFWRSIWGWGLPYYSGPKRLCQYRETELKHREVKFDEEGYPVHPDTRKRTVQLYSRWVEFLLNILIFIILPILAIFWWPICWCYAWCQGNIIGYRWIFSATRKSSSSTESTSENSVSGSLSTSDQDVVKESAEESPTSKSTSKTGSDGGSGKSSSMNKWKTVEQEVGEVKNISDGANVDGVNSEKDTIEGTSKHSLTKSSTSGDRPHPLPETRSSQVVSRLPTSVENLPRYESRLSIEAYDGIADDQEANDVDYVLKQLRRSSTVIQKSQERRASSGGSLSSKVMSISVRGEIIEDPELSPRMETSSDDSVPGGMMIVKLNGEPEGKDLLLADAAMDSQEPVLSLPKQVEPQSFELQHVSSSQGHPNALPADTEYSFQNTQGGPVMNEAYEKSQSATEDETIGSFSEVTTKDSLDMDEEGERLKEVPEEVVKALVEKLHAQRVVFRNFDHPIGEIEFPTNQSYCIRGYFLQTNGGYKFIPPSPLWQYWTLDADGLNMEPLTPPKALFTAEYERDYPNMHAVAAAGDLSDIPLSTCVNVQYQDFDSPLSAGSFSKPLE